LLHEPEVLILDEPTIGLDPAQIRDARDLIQALGKERTILLSTHILSEAQQVCDRVLIINKGKIVAEDSPERLQSRLAGAQRIRLIVRGDSDGLPGVLEGVQGVGTILPGEAGSIEFEAAPGLDARPEVARAVVNAGFDLLELRPVGMTLEEIFLQLTREEPSLPEMAEAELEEDQLDE
jgi:ABC-2 type transport system ATP-binding protein